MAGESSEKLWWKIERKKVEPPPPAFDMVYGRHPAGNTPHLYLSITVHWSEITTKIIQINEKWYRKCVDPSKYFRSLKKIAVVQYHLSPSQTTRLINSIGVLFFPKKKNGSNWGPNKSSTCRFLNTWIFFSRLNKCSIDIEKIEFIKIVS